MSELLTPDEFAIEAGVSRKTVYNYINEGRISSERHPATKRIMIPISEVGRLLDGGETTAPTGTTATGPGPIIEKPPATLHEYIIAAIGVAHGREVAGIVESKWDANTEATINFMTKTLKMEPNIQMIYELVKKFPPDQASLHPLTWLPALLTATTGVSGPLETTAPAPPAATPPERAMTPREVDSAAREYRGMRFEEDEEGWEDDTEDEEGEPEPPAPPPMARRRTAKPRASSRPARTPARQVTTCPVCLQQNESHASGCPRQKVPHGVQLKDGGMETSRFRSPAAAAAQAKAFAERAARHRTGEPDLMDEWEECLTPANCNYPHRPVRLEGRAGHVMGHFLSEVERVDEARGVFRDMGAPANASPPPEAFPRETPTPPAPSQGRVRRRRRVPSSKPVARRRRTSSAPSRA